MKSRAKANLTRLTGFSGLHLLSKFWSGWPVYEVKCLCSRGQVERRQGWQSHKLFNIWFLFLMTWRACEINLVMISSLALKWQVLKVGMPVFSCFMNWNGRPLSLVLAFWSQWRYHDQIWITSSSYHKNQIWQCW